MLLFDRCVLVVDIRVILMKCGGQTMKLFQLAKSIAASITSY